MPHFAVTAPGDARQLGRPLPYLVLALGCTILESIPSFDRLAQAPFFRHGTWLLDDTFHARYKWLLYTGPKVVIGIVGGVFLLVFLASFSRRFHSRLYGWRMPSLIVLCSIIFAPLLIASLKAISGIYSPVDLLPFGGRHPHVGLFEQLWSYGTTAGGRSFPAGHASGGFALMALYYLPLPDFSKRLLFVTGLFTGWFMGLYQMARGEHFLSHTLVAMFLSLAVITLFFRLTQSPRQDSNRKRQAVFN